MTAQRPMPLQWTNIPDEMRDARRWVVWRSEQRADPCTGEVKSTKVPYRAGTPDYKASATNARSWGTYAQAVAAYSHWDCDGIGFVLGDGWAGVDFDHCAIRHDDGWEVDVAVLEAVRTLDTYAEVSPSETGVHVLLHGEVPSGGRKRGPVEAYSTGRFFTVTGTQLGDTPNTVNARQDALADFCRRHFPAEKRTDRTREDARRQQSPPLDLDDEALIALALIARDDGKFSRLWDGDTKGYPSPSEAVAALLCKLAFWTRKNAGRMDTLFRRSGLMGPKWDEKRAESTWGACEIESAIEYTSEVYEPRHDAPMSKQSAKQPKVPNPSKVPEDAQSKSVGTFGTSGHLRQVQLSDVQPEPVHWLDKGYIPLGKITNIIGDPGLGKSTLTLHYIACHTTGQPMPGGTRNAPGSAVLMSAEDGIADTIVPRLTAAGADLSRVAALTGVDITNEDGEIQERPIFIPRDIPRIRATIEETGATLLVIDPLTAYLDADVNSHRDQDVRTALAPLAKMADETGCAVVLVRHLNKAPGGNTLYRGGGSIGITGAARAELVVAADPEDENKRVVAVHKHNLHKPVPALSFELHETADEIPYVHWLGTSEHTAAQLLAMPADEETRSETDEAVEWLRDVLESNGGQIAASEALTLARKESISPKVLRSAREKLCGKPEKEGFTGGKWIWRLAPTKMPTPPKVPEDAHSQDMGTFDETGHLRSEREYLDAPCPHCHEHRVYYRGDEIWCERCDQRLLRGA